MVRAGMGSAVLPWLIISSCGAQADPTLTLHELRPALPPREIFLVWQAGRTHSPLAARAIEIAIAAAAEIAVEADRRTAALEPAARPSTAR